MSSNRSAHSSDQEIEKIARIERRVMARLERKIAYATVNPDLTIETISTHLRPFLAAHEFNPVGRPVFESFEELVGLEDTLAEILNGSLPELLISHINRPGQSPEIPLRYFNLLIFPRDSEHPPAGLLLLVEEQTDQAHLQQELVQERNQLRLIQAELAQANRRLQRLDQLKTLFLSMAAHDLRTPLAIIDGYLDLMNEAFVHDDKLDRSLLRRDITVMQNQISWMNRLIGNVLDLNLIENELLVVARQPVDVGQILEDVAASTRRMLEVDGKSIVLSLPAEPVMVSAEPDRLNQILVNLVGNSYKFIKPGGQIELALSADRVRDKGVIVVGDDGPGIDPEFHEHLFKLYYRTPESNKIQGVGLGLYIVKTLVEQHQGTIRVDSERGAGTRFIIELPLYHRAAAG